MSGGTSPPEKQRTLPKTGGSSLVRSSHITWNTAGQVLAVNEDGPAATATAQVGARITDLLAVLGHRTFCSFWFGPEMSCHR